MTKTLFILVATLALAGCETGHRAPVAIESQVLLKSTASWDGTPYTAYPKGQPELTLLKIRIPADTTLNWHRHPVPNAAYVVAGQLTVQARDSANEVVLKAGDTLAEMVDIMHRGVTGNEPVELIVFYAGTAQTPLSY
ncbi:cupin domain-containing protein [Pseudomonas syringae]|nr:cupin domain-containing protein [Pseudomonas syringae]MBD8577611.1 cupin domain-containing protein [Pseudomonas syringae]MBD8792296.1 cupin domain-containing protein [Pseudomonas syringae]MBD8803569.1 cupin domain-containing protein [Pseudomonas syringae]MBD8814742.1 cupin domain-containing protein [Pseudomonas syringae]